MHHTMTIICMWKLSGGRRRGDYKTYSMRMQSSIQKNNRNYGSKVSEQSFRGYTNKTHCADELHQKHRVDQSEDNRVREH